jgi:two-component system alkaline phosphatase synthesis response regulator PhoP
VIWKKSRKAKVLVIEDEPDVSKALRIRLKANGYDVVSASDSIEGVTLANKEKPDLIILDVMIPGGGGFAVAERLKQSVETWDIPMIFLTGIPGTEEMAYKVGARFYFRKPYNPTELLNAIKMALEQ